MHHPKARPGGPPQQRQPPGYGHVHLYGQRIGPGALFSGVRPDRHGHRRGAAGGDFPPAAGPGPPGGAGHVRRLNTQDMMEKLIKAAYYRAKNCTCGDEQGDSSCYGCLRMYRNQKYHDILKRRYVVDFLKDLVE